MAVSSANFRLGGYKIVYRFVKAGTEYCKDG